MYNRLYKLLLEGQTTGTNPYKTGKRVGKFVQSFKADYYTPKGLKKQKQVARIARKVSDRFGKLNPKRSEKYNRRKTFARFHSGYFGLKKDDYRKFM